VRQVVLDTETTGLEPSQGHRIIEIGCVELINRRLTGNRFHQYLQPERDIDEAAVEIHGITNNFLADKPRFAEIADDFLGFIRGAELIIHNAPFDVGFINHELKLAGETYGQIGDFCSVLDTLEQARQLHPGQRNNLDALCKRYGIDNSQRELHGALLDAEILADVYLAMTGGQVSLSLEGARREADTAKAAAATRVSADRPPLPVIRASAEELTAHQRYLQAMAKKNGGICVWQRYETEGGGTHIETVKSPATVV
jgi:DNA polymerase III subunit epsilon